MTYTISHGEYKGERYIPEHVRISDNPKTCSGNGKHAKKSILRIVETGEIKEFDSRSDMCEFLELPLNSLGKYMKHGTGVIFTIKKKEYEVIK